LGLLILLDSQNDLKIQGVRHIENRIVSLDEVDARPIKKGKSIQIVNLEQLFKRPLIVKAS